MLLCDIGNTSYHFYNNDKDFKKDTNSFNPCDIKEKVFYISVNQKASQKLKQLNNWIDLSIYVDKTKYYPTIGIDRIIACEAISNGVIVDAGSAITVDVVKDNIFQGGFIYPGLTSMNQAYRDISTLLDYSFNFELDLTKLPKNSRDAISYGYLKTLYSEVISYDMNIYLTGGDAKNFKKIFSNATVDEVLIFRGMKKILSKTSLL